MDFLPLILALALLFTHAAVEESEYIASVAKHVSYAGLVYDSLLQGAYTLYRKGIKGGGALSVFTSSPVSSLFFCS